MNKIELYHFCKELMVYDPKMMYKQENRHKPKGLWVSDESDYGWKEWCNENEFGEARLKTCYKVDIIVNSNLLVISNVQELKDFTSEYAIKLYEFLFAINWEQVAKDYGGVIITPHQGTLGLGINYTWYYGWDCASGCIWDLNLIGGIDVQTY